MWMNREGENTEQRSERRVQKNRREKKNRAEKNFFFYHNK